MLGGGGVIAHPPGGEAGDPVGVDRLFGRAAAGELGDPPRLAVVAVEEIDPGDALRKAVRASSESSALRVSSRASASTGWSSRSSGWISGSSASATASPRMLRGRARRGWPGRPKRRCASGRSGRLSAPRARASRARSPGLRQLGRAGEQLRQRRELDPGRAGHGVEHRPGEVVQRPVRASRRAGRRRRPSPGAQGGEDGAVIVALGGAELGRRGEGAGRLGRASSAVGAGPGPRRARGRRRRARPASVFMASVLPSASAGRPRRAS